MFVTIRSLALSGALIGSIALPLAAQRGGPPLIQGQGPGMPAMGPEGAPRMTPRGPAGALLAARAQLGLTDDQVKRLETLATQQGAALAPAPGDMMRARADLLDAMKGEGDAAALKRAMDKAHQLRTERALAMLKARQDARAILTADQRVKADAMRPMRGGMGRGRMMRGGRMRGGMGPQARPDRPFDGNQP